MPAIRNVNPSRQSGLGDQTQVIHNALGNGWPIPETVNRIPNGEPLDVSILQCPVSFSSSVGSLPIQFDPQYYYSRQQPCISSDGQLYPSTNNASRLPSPRKRHTRRREPGYIPRPRNAFIVFRSYYIAGRSSAGEACEGQQNELSKEAGKVWNTMTDAEKGPYTLIANLEKQNHREMYPNYVYCPRLVSTKRKGSASTNKAGNTGQLPLPRTLLVSSKSASPEIVSAPILQLPRTAAQLAVQRSHSTSLLPTPVSPPEEFPMPGFLEVAYPELKHPATMDVVGPTPGTRASKLETLIKENHFVPMDDIPELELTPSKKEEYNHKYDLSMRTSSMHRIPEQFGFKHHNDFTAMWFAHLPLMPNFSDTTCPNGPPFCSPAISVPDNISKSFMTDNTPNFWQPIAAHFKVPQQPAPDFLSYSRILSPGIPTPHNASFVFSMDGNVPDRYHQQPMNDSAAPQLPVPGFTWSSEPHDDPMSFKDPILENDLFFMSNLDSLP